MSAPEQSGRVNLTKLFDARSKMTVGEYVLAEHDEAGDEGALHVVALKRHEGGEVAEAILVAIMPDAMRADDDAAGLVATHNAAPALIDVARTGLLLKAATSHQQKAGHSVNDWVEACRAERAAAAAYDAALAKVTL